MKPMDFEIIGSRASDTSWGNAPISHVCIFSVCGI